MIDLVDRAVAAIEAGPTGQAHVDAWRNAHQALKKTNADPMKVGRVIAARDLPGLKALVETLKTGGGLSKELEKARAASALMRAQQEAGAPPPAAPVVRPVGGPAPSAMPAAPAGPPPTDDECVRAFKAFRKRLKATRLDEESKISSRQLTSGSRGNLVAITPPREFRREVWEELVRRGHIKRSGSGMYELVERAQKPETWGQRVVEDRRPNPPSRFDDD